MHEAVGVAGTELCSIGTFFNTDGVDHNIFVFQCLGVVDRRTCNTGGIAVGVSGRAVC